MTDKENYAFDVAGYLIVRDVLTSEEVDACNRALGGADLGSIPLSDPFVRLRDHPILTQYLDQLIAEEVLLDRGPWVVGEREADRANCLVGGNEPRDPSRAYYFQNGIKFCQGMLAIWALSDVHPGDGGFVLVPASHKSSVETPSDLVSGTDDMGLVSQPVLKAGDLLLCVETILHGFVPGKEAPRLVAYGYASETALRNLAQADQSLAEAWASEMTPLQRAVMLPAGCPDHPPVLKSDGETCEIAETPGIFHPSIYRRDPDCGMDEKELYQWDLCGHLVL
ncbi:MAG: hypothetical protein O7G87_13695, partial [bacterium]|nr:hypothetical protein [bacterium]